MVPKKQPFILYVSPTCPACNEIEPLVKKLAKETKAPLRIQEIDKCSLDDSFCRTLQYVPTLAHQGREVPLNRAEVEMRRKSGGK